MNAFAVVVLSDVIDLHGPFPDAKTARAWADENCEGNYWVQDINTPSNKED